MLPDYQIMNGVIMLVNEFPPISGGAEKQAERLAAFVAQMGRPVWVITRRFPGLDGREERDGYIIIRPATFGPGKIKTFTFVLGALWHLWRLRGSYEILHAHMLFGPAFVAAFAGYVLRKRVLVKLGSSGPTGEIAVSLRTLRGQVRLASLRRWADRIIVLDKSMRAEAISAGFPHDKVIEMVNGIDSKNFHNLSKKFDIVPKGRVGVLFVGRLVEEKSISTLIEAFNKAFIECPQLYLLIVGSGREYDGLMKKAVELEIQDQISFAGNQEDVRPYLASADIFVLPSKNEGMSNALLEGMAAGLPCLATPVGASSQMLGDGKFGLLIPAGNVEAWAEALSEMGQNPGRRAELGKAARQRIRDKYDFSVVGARYDSLYSELVTSNKGEMGRE